MLLRRTTLFLTLACLPAAAQQPADVPLTAESIMARVAANQDASEAERARYVYVQHARTTSRKGKTVMCEEVTDFRVTPASTGSTQQLLKLDGRLLYKHRYLTYNHLEGKSPIPADAGAKTSGVAADEDDISITVGDDDMDRDLVENMRHNLTDAKSKDGFAAGLFPLTSKAQADYIFRLVGRERLNGRDVFHLSFTPKDKDDFGWKGEAYIESTAFQPVLVRTALSRNVPLVVRTLLGTSVPGLGFTAIYAPQPDGLWFPVSFGTEFKLHVLFFLNREITLSVENRDFEKTHVSSTILGSDGPIQQDLEAAPK